MALSVSELRSYIRNDFNVLLQGKHGTGKTTMLMDACASEGLKIKVFNAASMDAYTDLVGVPKFVTLPDGQEALKNVRPREIDEADVIFIDELNRAYDPKTTNAVFELVQFRSINGENLPNLRCVIAAQNPPEDDKYDVNPLDPALVDRFHLVIDVKPNVSSSYLSTKFDRDVAAALSKWYREHDKNTTENYISPRRVEMLGHVFMGTKSKVALKAALPPGGTYDLNKLYTLLSEAALTPEERATAEKERQAQLDRLTQKKATKSDDQLSIRFNNVIRNATSSSPDINYIRRQGPEAIKAALASSSLTPSGREEVIRSVALGIGVNRLFSEWTPVFDNMYSSEIRTIKRIFGYQKLGQVKRKLNSMLDTSTLGTAFVQEMSN